MKLRHYLGMVPVGVLMSMALSVPACDDDPVPCTGPQTVNGDGCGSGCPPVAPEGCCAYIEYRVNCDVGPDQFYRTRDCSELSHCVALVIPKKYACWHIY